MILEIFWGHAVFGLGAKQGIVDGWDRPCMSTPLLCHPLHLVVPPVSFVISIHSSLMPPACLLQGHSASTWKVRKLYTTGKQKIYFNHRVTLFWNSILQVFVSVSVINYMKQRIKKKWLEVVSDSWRHSGCGW